VNQRTPAIAKAAMVNRRVMGKLFFIITPHLQVEIDTNSPHFHRSALSEDMRP
jgi:hypothetical protein